MVSVSFRFSIGLLFHAEVATLFSLNTLTRARAVSWVLYIPSWRTNGNIVSPHEVYIP